MAKAHRARRHDRRSRARPSRRPSASRTCRSWPNGRTDALPKLGGLDRYTALACLTHDPKIDDPALVAGAAGGVLLYRRARLPPHACEARRAADRGRVSTPDAIAPHPCADRARHRRRHAGRDRGLDPGRDRRRASGATGGARRDLRRGPGRGGRRGARGAQRQGGRRRAEEGPAGHRRDGRASCGRPASSGSSRRGSAPDDVGEDEAAGRLARSASRASVSASSRPFTGRANLFAEHAGHPGRRRADRIDADQRGRRGDHGRDAAGLQAGRRGRDGRDGVLPKFLASIHQNVSSQ